MKPRKRFIAGAICPKCHAEDRIVLHQQEAAEWIECVACGFKQTEAETTAKSQQTAEIVVKWPTRHKIE